MGRIDARTRAYLADAARFADAFNFYVYGGRRVIDPDELSPADTAALSTLVAGERRRDVFKGWQAMRGGDVTYALLGLESQARVHYAMPARCMLYDALGYMHQVEERSRSLRARRGIGGGVRAKRRQKGRRKARRAGTRLSSGEFLSGWRRDDRLVPVVTLVIHFGAEPWDGPLTLHEMLGGPEELANLVPDYRLNLISPDRIDEGDFDKFATGLGRVLRYVKHSKDGAALARMVGEDDGYRRLDEESADLINELTGSRLRLEPREGAVDMCEAIQQIRREAAEQGMRQGMRQGIEQGMRQGRLEAVAGLVLAGMVTVEDASRAAGVPEDDVRAAVAAAGN